MADIIVTLQVSTIVGSGFRCVSVVIVSKSSILPPVEKSYIKPDWLPNNGHIQNLLRENAIKIYARSKIFDKKTK
jgi:hypothetical protein